MIQTRTARVAPEKAVFRPVLPRVHSAGALPEKAMSKFWELYKDPRWQKKRLEIMQFYSFKCGHCGSGEKTLNVHHRIYHKGRDPWDYDDSELQCLCEDCHEESHSLHKSIKSCLVYLDDSVAAIVLGYLRAHMASCHPDSRVYVHNLPALEGTADFCLGTTNQVDAALDEYQSISGAELMRLRKENERRFRDQTAASRADSDESEG
jgi:hypothetical protein